MYSSLTSSGALYVQFDSIETWAIRSQSLKAMNHMRGVDPPKHFLPFCGLVLCHWVEPGASISSQLKLDPSYRPFATEFERNKQKILLLSSIQCGPGMLRLSRSRSRAVYFGPHISADILGLRSSAAKLHSVSGYHRFSFNLPS